MKAWAAACLGLALWAGTAGNAHATRPECSICDLPTRPAEKAEFTSKLAYWACRSAIVITCEDSDPEDCWVTGLVESVHDGAEHISKVMPEQLARPEILGVIAAILVLTFTIDGGRMMVGGGSLAQSPIPGRIMRAMVAMAVTQAALGGWAEELWRWTGFGMAAGGLIGRALGEQMLAAGAVGGVDSCFDVEASTEVTEDTLVGWEGAKTAIYISVRQASELSAVLLGVAWTLMPNVADVVETYGKTVSGVVTGDFTAVFEVLRTMFAVTLVGTAMTLMMTVAFQVLESILVIGLIVGMAPVWAWLWLWEGSRRATHQALAGVLYAVASLIFLGVTVQVARHAMEFAVVRFTVEVKNPEYDLNSRLASDCGSPPDIAVGNGLRDAYKYFLCMATAETHKREHTKKVWIFTTTRTEDVHASKMESEVISWLPELLLLIGGAVVVTAIMRYGNAAASEITGFRASQNQIAQQALGAGKGLLGGVSRRMGAMGMGVK